MSTPSSSPASADLTRQQLDELDALLQRMLELPVHPLEERALSEAPSPASLSVLEADPEPIAGPRSVPNLAAPDYTPPVEFSAPPPRHTPERLPTPEPAPDEHLETLAVWWTPLVWGNDVFDDAVARLGKPGLWLRRSSGRALLGWVGLLCLAAAAGLLIWDWIRTSW